jgi:hypothetical protein
VPGVAVVLGVPVVFVGVVLVLASGVAWKFWFEKSEPPAVDVSTPPPRLASPAACPDVPSCAAVLMPRSDVRPEAPSSF